MIITIFHRPVKVAALLLLVQHFCSPGEVSAVGGETSTQRWAVRATSPFNRGRLARNEQANSVASPSYAGPLQRAQRDGPTHEVGLRYALNPWETRLLRLGPTSRSAGRARSLRSWSVWGRRPRRRCTSNCCDALRCSGPHARYTDRANEFITLAGRSG